MIRDKISLNNLKINEKAKIKNLNCTGAIRRRLLDLGLIEGTMIIPVLKSPSGDPVAYEIRGTIIALRKEDSSLIEILCV